VSSGSWWSATASGVRVRYISGDTRLIHDQTYHQNIWESWKLVTPPIEFTNEEVKDLLARSHESFHFGSPMSWEFHQFLTSHLNSAIKEKLR
jgi:hypothetical protein